MKAGTIESSAPKQLSVREMLDWITTDSSPFGLSCPLTLPPLQRNGVWRPKQVLDLWRSVLDGMPIGLFYLQPTKDEVVSRDDPTQLTTAPSGALNLFDGQQRIRALALGADDPFGEKRRIWVRFTDNAYELVLSSQTQPAGYKPDGSRLSVADLRKWYDRSGEGLQAEAPELHYPDYPFGCSPDDTRRLMDLLALGTNQSCASEARKPPQATDKAWSKLQEDLTRLRCGCAIFIMLPGRVVDDAEKTLELFRRIGAGGTPLSQAEQVYSAYKLRKPTIRLTVETIHKDISALLTPAQIVQAALRMANTLADRKTGWPPGFDTAIKAFLPEPGEAGVKPWVEELDTLLTDAEGKTSLVQAFERVRALLSRSGKDAFSLPQIVMAQLPAELWQVLAFWCLTGDRDRDLAGSQAEVVRFAMAWHLAVKHQERATQICFRELAVASPAVFPGKALFARLLEEKGTALQIPEPAVLESFFIPVEEGQSPRWLSQQERFPAAQKHSEFASTWWFSRKMLPWLQREYVKKRFGFYQPLSDHEDDLPYDWDHICPQAHWGPDGRGVGWEKMEFDSQADRDNKTPEPWMVGNSLGNMRLVNFSQNRKDGDADIFEKMPFLEHPDQSTNIGSASDFLLDDVEELSLWRKVGNGTGHKWDATRLSAFQSVVERRTARLYAEFYDKLGFKDWNETKT